MPPQNSGQYYCTSPVKKPTKTTLTWQSISEFDSPHNGSGDGNREVKISSMYYAGDDDWDHASDSDIFGGNRRGRLRFYAGWMDKIDYNDDWVSGDNNGVLGEDQNYFASIYGVAPASYYTATADCELADDDQQGSAGSTDSDGSTSKDTNAIRLIDAGNGYGEYFLRINDDSITQTLGILGLPTNDSSDEFSSNDSAGNKAARADFLDAQLSDNVISYFRISPIDNGAAGRIACGYQAAWVDGIGNVNYDDASSNRQADSEWRRKFFEHYNSFLTRGQESVYATKNGTPYQVDCVGRDSQKCYMKYWELNYRSDNQKKFYGLQRLGPDGLPTDTIVRSLLDIRRDPIQSSCSESKPYFAVRAVFESVASRTSVPATGGFTANDVQGPWRFVGFWVSACGGDTGGDQRYIYMNVDVGTASVCKELAEVKSRDSNQDAAFTDRVWSKGDFREPATGLQYSDNASPFSSAINTGPAGKDPLFQTGSEITGFSPLNPPTWLAPPSRTITRNNPIPKDNWAMLSNLFARIYRVYRFQFLPVTKTDKVCMDGPFQGTRCTPFSATTTASNTCGVDSTTCTNLAPSEAQNFRVCDGSSNVNRPFECSENPEICRVPSFAKRDGTVKSVVNSCAPRVGWAEIRPGFWRKSGSTNEYSTEQAGKLPVSAFGCQNNIGSNISGTDAAGTPTDSTRPCSSPEAQSFDCPVKLTGTCVTTGGVFPGVCQFTGSDATALTRAGIDVANHEEQIYCYGGASQDCQFLSVPAATACHTATYELGRCNGGVRDSSICWPAYGNVAGTIGSCMSADYTDARKAAIKSSCLSVSDPDGSPTAACLKPGSTDVVTTEANPDKDNNLCTNSGGYQPRTDLCPDPNDEFCGLVSYKLNDTSAGGSIDPHGPYPLPTDNTLGMYTPTRLGFTGASAATFRFMAYYNPGPPRVAAPNTRNCPSPGQCEVSSVDRFDFNGQTEGAINVGGGTHKSTLRFYAWADPNQMPLRETVIDWGDSQTQRLDDTRLKNRKPFCGVQRECSGVPGLTCETDADCAAGLGQCVTVGYCAQNQNLACHTNADCTTSSGIADTCTIRTRFGNSSDACQVGYFDFSHLYSCGADQVANLPTCTNEFRCSRDSNRTCPTPGSNTGCAPGDVCLENLAPVGGCFDASLRQCRFTPRVMLQDNWGWCTGECRSSTTGGFPDDNFATAQVRHPNGGCWAGSTLGSAKQNIRINTRATGANGVPGNVVLPDSECNENYPNTSHASIRPWIVYPGSLQLRESGELAP